MTKTKIALFTIPILAAVLIGATLLPVYGVDPDMQALVVDNSSNLNGCFFFCPIRDNVIVHDISLEENERLIIVDNAGIGGTSDVEVTMRSEDDDDTCTIQITDGVAWTDLALADFPVTTVGEVNVPQHGDASGVEAVSLFGGSDGCDLSVDDGEYVAVSTVGSSP